MALSFFGKKTPAASPPREQAGVRPDKGGRQTQPPRTELSTLDFSGGDANRALAQCAELVEVQEVGSGIGAIYEEAAVLYANGNNSEAEKVLASILDEAHNTAGEGLWMMLLDLYRLTGQRDKFESRVLDYATRFERSPPPWLDLSSQPSVRQGDRLPLVNLAGSLSGQAATQFQQIGVIGRKSGGVRIDLGKLRAVDETGCTLLRQTLASLAADRVKVALLNGASMANMLAGQIAPGKAESRDMWLLLLELLQHTGEQERFEQIAVDYAITFEESPPSWEGREQMRAAVSTAGLAAPAAPAGGDEGFRLEGELVGASNDAIKRLAAFAGDRRNVSVDCGRLRRLDFVSAGTLFNILATLQAQGKLVELQNVNAMVAALLRVMGVDQVAQVTLRI